MIFRLIDETPLHSGFLTVSRLQVETDEGVVGREVEDHGPAASVLAYDPERRVAMLVEVLRLGPLKAGADPRVLEAAAGMIDDGETPEAAARREAQEETGLELGDLEPLGAFWSAPGVSSERVWLYLGPYGEADRTSTGGGKPGEQEGLEPQEHPLDELWSRLESGDLPDMKTVLLLQALRLRRPELFEQRSSRP